MSKEGCFHNDWKIIEIFYDLQGNVVGTTSECMKCGLKYIRDGKTKKIEYFRDE